MLLAEATGQNTSDGRLQDAESRSHRHGQDQVPARGGHHGPVLSPQRGGAIRRRDSGRTCKSHEYKFNQEPMNYYNQKTL